MQAITNLSERQENTLDNSQTPLYFTHSVEFHIPQNMAFKYFFFNRTSDNFK